MNTGSKRDNNDPSTDAGGLRVPLVDLRAQREKIASEIDEAVQSVLSNCDFILGNSVLAFEEAFAGFCESRYAVGCNSGTDALQLALRALDIGPGDEVIVPAMTFVATAMAVRLTGASPVLADVSPDNALIDRQSLQKVVTKKTRAVLPVHLFGQAVDMAEIDAVAKDAGISVVEDAAQAHGAKDAGRSAGSLGLMGCFSFYPGKNLGAYGDGGAITTSDPDLDQRLRSLRNMGSPAKHVHDETGLNSRLDTIQAAILRVKLKYLKAWNARRTELAVLYDEALATIPGVQLTKYKPDGVYHLYVIRVDNRDEVLKRLSDAGIFAGIHYPVAVHQTPAYAELGNGPGSFPCAEDWAARCISLPMYPELPERAIAVAADALRKCL